MIRSRMKKVAKNLKATWVTLQHVDWVAEEDVADDGIHFSKAGTKKIMETVGEKIKEVTGTDVLAGMEMQEKPYNGIYRGHYKIGARSYTIAELALPFRKWRASSAIV